VNITPIDSLSKWVITLLKAQVFLLSIAVIAGSAFLFIIYAHYAAGDYVDDTQLMGSDRVVFITVSMIYMIAGLLGFLLFIVLGISFLKWIYMVNKNLNILSDGSLRFTPGWSIGWYFIPIACFYKPYQAMKEIFLVCKDNPNAETGLLKRWWFLWILSTFVAEICVRTASGPDVIETDFNVLVIATATSAIDIILAIVAISLVKEIWISYERNIVVLLDGAESNITQIEIDSPNISKTSDMKMEESSQLDDPLHSDLESDKPEGGEWANPALIFAGICIAVVVLLALAFYLGSLVR
jgi:hypothetical protein